MGQRVWSKLRPDSDRSDLPGRAIMSFMLEYWCLAYWGRHSVTCAARSDEVWSAARPFERLFSRTGVHSLISRVLQE